jgi:hypothetical protein
MMYDGAIFVKIEVGIEVQEGLNVNATMFPTRNHMSRLVRVRVKGRKLVEKLAVPSGVVTGSGKPDSEVFGCVGLEGKVTAGGPIVRHHLVIMSHLPVSQVALEGQDSEKSTNELTKVIPLSAIRPLGVRHHVG